MRKQLFALMAVLTLSACAGTGKKENSLSIDNTKGDVESIVIKVYEADMKFGEIYFEEGYADMLFERIYDKKGNLSEVSIYDDEDMTLDNLDSKTVYKYDENNKTSEILEYDWNGELEYRMKYVYDGDKVKQYTVSYENENLADISYKYEGSRLSEVYDNLRDVVGTKYVYSQKEYDEYVFTEGEEHMLVLMKGEKVMARKKADSEETFEYEGNNVVRYNQRYDEYSAGCSIVYDKHNNITAIYGAEVDPYFLAIPSNILEILNRDIFLEEGEYEFEISYVYDKKGNWTKAICYAGYDDEYLVLIRDIIYR